MKEKKIPSSSKKPQIKKTVAATTVAKAKKSRAPKKEQDKIATFGLHTLHPPKGSHKKKKILGRGSSSGHGKTSTRGSKGQTSRSGRDFYLGFEGGQSPLIRRFPKRGFAGPAHNDYQIVNLENLEKIKDASVITPELLEQKNLIKNKNKPVKILGDGELKKALNVKAHAFSKKAQDKIKSAGGTTEIIL